jgi:hypothetical protein
VNQQPDNPGQDRTAPPLTLPESAVRDVHAALGRLLADPDTVTIPVAAFDGLVAVAMHVSYGKRAAFSVGPYPDSTARVALGALDEAHLLDAYRQRHPEAGE